MTLSMQFSSLWQNNMIEIPNIDSVESVADWVELMLALEGGEISKATISSVIEGNLGSEVPETFLSAVWRSLEYRSNLYNFPVYLLSERTVESRLDLVTRGEYLMCLILSLFGVPGNAQVPGKLFERITKEAVKNYLHGEAIVFGWPFERIEGNDEPAIMQMVKLLALTLSEKFCETPASRFKDRGLDVVGWTPHSDKRSSQVVILLQCAAGHNWVDKLPVPSKAWCQYIHWASNPITAFAVPCVIGEREWHEASNDKGILFDRIRIINLVKNGIEDAELREAVDSWTHNELQNHLV